MYMITLMVYSYTASCMINGHCLFTEAKDSAVHDYQTIELDNKTYEKSIVMPHPPRYAAI